MGEGGQRYAVLLRQNTMGDLSPIDPRAAIGVQFPGALSETGVQISVSTDGTKMYVIVDDVTELAPGVEVVISSVTQNGTVPAWAGTYPIASIALGQAIYGDPGSTVPIPFPGGTTKRYSPLS